ETEEFALRVQYDLDRNSLNDFREIARRVVRGQQGELLSACRRDAVNMTLKPRTRKRVDLDRHGLTLADISQLRLLVIGDDVDAFDRDDRHEIGAGLYELPNAQGPVSHHSVHRRRDRGVTEIQFRLLCDGPLLLQRSIRLRQLRTQYLR